MLAGEHDHLGVGRQRQDLAQQLEALRSRRPEQAAGPGPSSRRRAHGAAAARWLLPDCWQPPSRTGVEGPAHLLLQRRIVLDDQQSPSVFQSYPSLLPLCYRHSEPRRQWATRSRSRFRHPPRQNGQVPPQFPEHIGAPRRRRFPIPLAFVVWKAKSWSRMNAGDIPDPVSRTTMHA